jgi:ubiquinone/menaquinone biosynthesis C-methylase UbiE
MKMNEKNTSIDTYPMGRTSGETRRLRAQAQILNPLTRRLFEQAGITTGMNVLDLGSGAGDVALLLADMVGPQGTVVGVEVNPTILDTARARVREAGLINVNFFVGDLASIQFDTQFDAIVGRAVLMYLPDPATVLRKLASYLRPGGIVAFQEVDLERLATVPAHPPNQIYEQAATWVLEAFRLAGIPLRIGLEMYNILQNSGFPPPHMGCEGCILAGPDPLVYEHFAETVRSLLPLILKFGIATEEEIAIDTLAERLQVEAISQKLVVRGTDMISAWTRTAAQVSV